jgi:hypothetical protein
MAHTTQSCCQNEERDFPNLRALGMCSIPQSRHSRISRPNGRNSPVVVISNHPPAQTDARTQSATSPLTLLDQCGGLRKRNKPFGALSAGLSDRWPSQSGPKGCVLVERVWARCMRTRSPPLSGCGCHVHKRSDLPASNDRRALISHPLTGDETGVVVPGRGKKRR